MFRDRSPNRFLRICLVIFAIGVFVSGIALWFYHNNKSIKTPEDLIAWYCDISDNESEWCFREVQCVITPAPKGPGGGEDPPALFGE